MSVGAWENRPIRAWIGGADVDAGHAVYRMRPTDGAHRWRRRADGLPGMNGSQVIGGLRPPSHEARTPTHPCRQYCAPRPGQEAFDEQSDKLSKLKQEDASKTKPKRK